jgi:hypothetical protein
VQLANTIGNAIPQIFRARLSVGWRLLYLEMVGYLVFAASSNWFYDDPFITYRYAQNLAHGYGFVYNSNQPTLSTTTPLFTLLLAVVSLLSNDIPNLAKLIGAISLAMGALFLWELSQVWETPTVGWVGLALYPFFPLLLLTIGSEEPLYLALCLAALVFYARQHYDLSLAFTALAGLTRPDGILLTGVLAYEFLFRKRAPVPRKGIFTFLCLTLSWLILAWIYFDSPIPITLIAKQRQGMLEISQSFAERFLPLFSIYAGKAAIILALCGIFFAFWRSRQWTLLFTWAFLYFACYSLLGVSGYHWYYGPLEAAFIVAIGLSICSINSGLVWVFRNFSRPEIRTNTLRYAAIVILLAPILIKQTFGFRDFVNQADPRYPVYRSAGEWLASNTRGDIRVGTFETGILGYYAHRSMIDFAGLLQPDIATQLGPETSYEQAASWAVTHYHPEYLVLLKDKFPKLERGYITKYCQLVKDFRSDSKTLLPALNIYACNKATSGN